MKPPTRTPGTAAAWLFENASTVAAALLIAFALRTLLFQPFTIPSSSMEPTLRTGDYLIVSKFSYGWSRFSIPFHPPAFKGRLFLRQPRRGDVIVFKLPRNQGRTDYVKRLIGLPGDRVQINRNTVYVNGKPFQRTPGAQIWDPESELRQVTQVRETNAEGRPYVLYQEALDHDGETTGVYVVPKGQYFFMGDNRDNSLDSRWPSSIGVGFVPAENLVGKVEFVVASWRDGASVFKPWTWLNLDSHRFLHPVY